MREDPHLSAEVSQSSRRSQRPRWPPNSPPSTVPGNHVVSWPVPPGDSPLLAASGNWLSMWPFPHLFSGLLGHHLGILLSHSLGANGHASLYTVTRPGLPRPSSPEYSSSGNGSHRCGTSAPGPSCLQPSLLKPEQRKRHHLGPIGRENLLLLLQRALTFPSFQSKHLQLSWEAETLPAG